MIDEEDRKCQIRLWFHDRGRSCDGFLESKLNVQQLATVDEAGDLNIQQPFSLVLLRQGRQKSSTSQPGRPLRSFRIFVTSLLCTFRESSSRRSQGQRNGNHIWTLSKSRASCRKDILEVARHAGSPWWCQDAHSVPKNWQHRPARDQPQVLFCLGRRQGTVGSSDLLRFCMFFNHCRNERRILVRVPNAPSSVWACLKEG